MSTPPGRWSRLRSAAVALAALLVLAACVPLPRYRSSRPRHSGYPVQTLALAMDPWLLTDGLADRVLIEVDWVAGCEPGPLTLAGLHDIVAKYGPAGRPVEVRRDEEISRSEWDAVVKAAAGDNSEPPEQTLGGRHANPFVAQGTEHRYVLFAPHSKGLFGYNSTWAVERDGKTEPVSGIVVFRENHERYAKFWISLDEIERMTLIHEFGHQFGLVSDPRHERSDGEHRHHCTRLDCVMSHPTPRVRVHNIWRGLFGVFFTDYCKECQRDIRSAQVEFARQRAEDPAWLDKQRAKREGERAAATLQVLWKAGRSSDLLAESERLLAEFPGQPTISWYHMHALLALGRLDEALREFREQAADASRSRAPARDARWLALELGATGRFEEALDLLELYRGTDLDEQQYEQVTFVLITILREMGRPSEAADLVLALLERGHSISFADVEMERQAIELLGRAGRFAEADARLGPLMSGKHRANTLETAWRLRQAEAREAEARALARELLAFERRTAARASDPGKQRASLFRQAAALAFLERAKEASEAVDKMATGDPPLDPNDGVYELWVDGLVLTSRLDDALEAMARVSRERLKYWAICSNEMLAPLHDYAPAAAIFARCPQRSHAKRE